MSRNASRRRVLTVILALAVALVPALAFAAHPEGDFTDVPEDHTFHDDIQWMHDNGITRGCNPPENDQYCPDRELIRSEEAAFFHRYDGYLRESIEPRLVPEDCAEGQIAEFDGTGWVCADRTEVPVDEADLTVATGDLVEIAPAATETATASCAEADVALAGNVAPLTADLTVDSTTIEGGDVTIEVTNNGAEAAAVAAYAICTAAGA